MKREKEGKRLEKEKERKFEEERDREMKTNLRQGRKSFW